MRKQLISSGLLAGTALISLLTTPAAETQEGHFGEITDVTLVEIPVHVTRNGEPVRGLTMENFVVLEGKKKQDLVALDVIDLSLLPSSPGTFPLVPPVARRNFLMLFDLSNSAPAGIVRAREAAMDVARASLHPSDLVAVATYSRSHGVDLLMGFNSDRGQLLAALDDLGLVSQFDRPADPLRLVVAELGQEADFAASLELNRGQGRGLMLQALEEQQVLTARVQRGQSEQQIADMSSELGELASVLDSASGRKQIVLFSQGFDSEIVFGTRDFDRLQEMSELAQNELDLWRVDNEERFGSSNALRGLLTMLEQFNRSDCSIHTVDVGGLAADGDAASVRVGNQTFGESDGERGHEGLFYVANETGGEFYRNLNNLGDAMQDLLERTSVTYVLSVRPRELQLDGSYHPIKVRLKGVPTKADISHRPGYFAPRPFSELEATERQLASAELLLSGQAGGLIQAHVLAAPFETDSAEAYVLTAVEIDGASLQWGQRSNVVPAEVYTYAFDEAGRVRDFFTQAIGLDTYQVGYRLQVGFKLLCHLRLPAGRYQLRTLVRNGETGASGLAINWIDVPDYRDDKPDLLPPFFIESGDRWLVGEGKREGQEDLPYPLLRDGERLVPASKPLIPAGRRVPLLLVGKDLPSELEGTASLRPLHGTDPAENYEVTLAQRTRDLLGAERIVAYLRTGRLEPGDYELLITLAEPEGDVSASSAIAVEVIGVW